MPEPPAADLAALRAAAATCRACDLWQLGTQTVFGEGEAGARLMMVGEQPGDREDIVGRPFVGPAGELLERALTEAGIERSAVYVTNAVKHFRWVARGKRRLHQTPDAEHLAACRPWLQAEIDVVRPLLVVCLGATAAQAVIGPSVRVLSDRGTVYDSALGVRAMPTVHPSSVLRAPDDNSRRNAYRAFVTDLRRAAALLREA